MVIIGAGGHGKVAADIAKKIGYKKIAFLDDNIDKLNMADGFAKGTTNDICKFKGWDFFVAIGAPKIRKNFIKYLEDNGYKLISLIHPKSVVTDNVIIGVGTIVMAGAVINADTVIGKGCILNTCSSVDHDCEVGDYVHVSVGTHIAGTVRVGDMANIGAGATVINNINICQNVIIGAGAVIVKDVNEQGTYVGVPAKKIK